MKAQEEDTSEVGTGELRQQIRTLYLEYFRELPQAQQATARAFCYFSSVKSSPQEVAPLRNADDERSLFDAQYAHRNLSSVDCSLWAAALTDRVQDEGGPQHDRG
jgi:hypothetical protein